MERLDAFDMDMYIISNDQPEEQKLLYDELVWKYGKSFTFISDPNLELIEDLGMRNREVAYRGYAILDTEGSVLLKQVNDQWGEEWEKTIRDIQNVYKRLSD